MGNPKALNRREFLALSASTALAGGRQRRPNILLVVADDLGYSDLGCYGGEIETPVLDGLAANGLRFAQFYTTARCCPSRASILTGQYPHKVGVGHMVTDLGHPGYRGKLSENAVTLAEVLKSAGYRTFMSGKWHVGTNDPTRHGFEQYYGTLISAATFWDPEKYLRLPQGSRARSYDANAFYGTDALTDHALDFLADARSTPDQPWFLYLAYNAPHFPLHARPEDIAKYRDRYTAGWDALRQERLARMKRLKLVSRNTTLSPRSRYTNFGATRNAENPAWNSLPEDRRADLAMRMAIYAAMMCSEPDAAERGRAISAAKVQINKSARFVGQEAIQLHGGIGMTEECQAGHYFRRLSVIEMLFGDTAHHLRRVAAGGGLT